MTDHITQFQIKDNALLQDQKELRKFEVSEKMTAYGSEEKYKEDTQAALRDAEGELLGDVRRRGGKRISEIRTRQVLKGFKESGHVDLVGQ